MVSGTTQTARIAGKEYSVFSPWASALDYTRNGAWRAFDGDLGTAANGYLHYKAKTGEPLSPNCGTQDGCMYPLYIQLPNDIYLMKYTLTYTQTDVYPRKFTVWGCKTRDICELVDQRSGVVDWNGVKEFLIVPQNTYSLYKLVIEKVKADASAADNKEFEAIVKDWVLYGLDAPVKPRMQNGWLCIQSNSYLLVRRNVANEIECFSDDAKGCRLLKSTDECTTLAATDPSKIKPLACGEAHRQIYGASGYEAHDGQFLPYHWCNIGRSQLFTPWTGMHSLFE